MVGPRASLAAEILLLRKQLVFIESVESAGEEINRMTIDLSLRRRRRLPEGSRPGHAGAVRQDGTLQSG
jgi:hypothetical protein